MVIYEASNTTGVSSKNVTYNGAACTSVVATIQTNKYVIEVWKLVAPATGSNVVAISYQGTFQHVQVFAISFTGIDQTTPVAASTSTGENAITAATYPTTSVNINGGTIGFMAGAILYSNSSEGPSTNPAPFGTTDSNLANMVNSGGISSPGDIAQMFHGSYSGALTALSLTSNDGSGYQYILAAVSLNEVPTEPPFLPHGQSIPAPDNLRIIESCLYN